MRRVLVILCVAMIWNAGMASSAGAFCELPAAKVCHEFFKADAVFIGMVVSTKTISAGGDFYDGWTYTLRVTRMFKGSDQKTIDVYTENSSARFPLDNGKTYLLFAYSEKGRLVIYNCSENSEVAQAGATVAELERVMKRAKTGYGGEIIGAVAQPSVSGEEVPRAKITVEGEGKTFTASSDKNGWFDVHVPPGKYMVRATSDAGPLQPYDLSLDNPKNVAVQNGSCAEVQFQ